MNLEALLAKHFGFSAFKPGQKEVIQSILLKKDTLAMLPTGTGKSICYQLPAYQINGAVIIISPLLSLMQDQVEQMMARGEKRVLAINSFLNPDERSKALLQLERYKFIFVSPEILMNSFILSKLSNLSVGLLVVDEAHCISQWGYDFRPDYLKLGAVREKLGKPVTLALTATATKNVREDIVRILGLDVVTEIISTVDRPNIKMAIDYVEDPREKLKKLFEWVSYLEGPGIIYFSSKRMADEVANELIQSTTKRVMAYHAGVDQENRILIQQQFINGQLDVICATSAFGMGINKANIRFVIHFHMPGQFESYLQEIGRAGRDGMESLALLLYSPNDEMLPLQLIEAEVPSEHQVRWLFGLLSTSESRWDWKEFENELITYGGFTETACRLVKDLFESYDEQKDVEQVCEDYIEKLRLRKIYKQENVMNMVTLIKSGQCIREKILNYFDESKKHRLQSCCTVCGLDISTFRKAGNELEKQEATDWREHLRLLLTKSGFNT